MDEKTKQTIEQQLNAPSIRLRIRAVKYDEQKVKLLKRIRDLILDKSTNLDMLKPYTKQLEQILPEEEKYQANKIYGLFKDSLLKTQAQSAKADKAMALGLSENMRFEEEVKYFQDQSKSAEDITSHLSLFNAQEKDIIISKIIEDYHNNGYTDQAFVSANRALKHFGRKISRRIVGVTGKDKIKLTPEENQMARCVMDAKFYLPQDEDNKLAINCYTSAYLEERSEMHRQNNGPHATQIDRRHSASEYNLLEDNPLIKTFADSLNMRQMVGVLQETLAQKGISLETANQMNSYDFADILAAAYKPERVIEFSEYIKNTNTPRKEFCQKLVADKKTLEQILHAKKEAGSSDEYLHDWVESMKEGEPDIHKNPRFANKKYKGYVPSYISVHHKDNVTFGGSNDASNLVLIEDDSIAQGASVGRNHQREHMGDNKDLLMINLDKQFKNDPWLISLSSSDKDLNSRKGNIIVAEKLDVLDNEHSRDCRVFINNQASIENPNIRGNSDSMSYMAAEELKKHGRGGRD